MNVIIRLPFDGIYPITQRFGENPEVYSQFGKPGHNGIDWGLPNGTPILAAADGKVTKIGNDPNGYGRYILLQHNGYQTLYAHLQDLKVSVIEPIHVSDVIGFSDNTGFSTGPHLHFELRIPGSPGSYNAGEVDPLPYLQNQSDDVSRDQLALEYVRLARGNDYVNVRTGPGIEYPIAGKLLPEDEAKRVMDIDGKWICILKWQGVSLWAYWDYLEAVNAPSLT
jgi:hypothetical protein